MKTRLLLLMLTLGSVNSFAQAGALDTSFDPGAGANSSISTTAIQTDGKIIIGGDFTSYDGTTVNRIARLNDNGTLDNTFDPGSGPNSEVYTASVQADGKIIIGGDFTSYNGTAIKHIARLNNNGTLDNTFDPGAGPNDSVFTSFIQADGKIIIGGWFVSYHDTNINRIARLNADGTLDTSFDPGTGADNYIYTTSVQADGKIIIGGRFTSYNETGRNYIARLNADGTLDNTFDPGTGTDYYIYTTSVQADGKIIIGGFFTLYDGTGRNNIARLNTDGSLDTSFDPGTGTDWDVLTTSVQADGKIIIGGWFTYYNGTSINYIARLNDSDTAGINENNAIPGLSVYPNPAKDKVYVKLQTEAKYTLDNIFGQKVTKGFLVPGTNELNTRLLSNGLYFLNIETPEGKATKKLIKE